MGDTVLKVEGVSKKFARRLRYSMMYGTLDVARGMLGMEARTDTLRPSEFWAVDDVSFELKRGETLGLIGPNGSGKSTLLRLLNGIYQPDRGRIEITGRVGALIAVGAGFHPLMTGRENIYLNGSILGMSRAEINRKFDAIVEFADIGEFLDAPVKTYSTGMYVRLGFAIAIHCDPDILLVDEILAVGDAKFQQRCFSKINALRDAGKTIILVTHNTEAVLRSSSSAVLIEKGKLTAQGQTKKVIGRYLALLWGQPDGSESTLTTSKYQHAAADVMVESVNTRLVTDGGVGEYRDLCPQRPNYNKGEEHFGTGKANIVDFEILDSYRNAVTFVHSGERLCFRVKIVFREDVKCPVYGFSVKTKDGLVVYGNNTSNAGTSVLPKLKGETEIVEYQLSMSLAPGDYFLSAGVVEIADGEEEVLERRFDMAHIKIVSTDKWLGLADLNSYITVIDPSA